MENSVEKFSKYNRRIQLTIKIGDLIKVKSISELKEIGLESMNGSISLEDGTILLRPMLEYCNLVCRVIAINGRGSCKLFFEGVRFTWFFPIETLEPIYSPGCDKALTRLRKNKGISKFDMSLI